MLAVNGYFNCTNCLYNTLCTVCVCVCDFIANLTSSPKGLTSGQSVLSGGQFEWSNPPEDFRKKLFTLVTEINSQKNGMPQNARPQNVADS